MPKQFVSLFEEHSLFQLTLQRNAHVCDSCFIVSNTEQYFLAIDQLESLKNSTFNLKNTHFLLETLAKNTAPAIALSCMALDPDEIVLVTPSDHLIKNQSEYKKVVTEAKKFAKMNQIVTFGIIPASPHTGYGYIQAKINNNDSSVLDVTSFKEKPNVELALQYLEENKRQNGADKLKYYWNSGIFCFKAGIFLEELKKYSPDIYKQSHAAFTNKIDMSPTQCKIQLDDMKQIPEDSIDYAVMEKSQIVKVIPSSIEWNDVGSFESLYDELPKDNFGNTQNKNHLGLDSSNNFIYSQSKKIATIGVEDSIIVDTGDAVLIAKKGQSQKIKTLLKEIKKTSDLHNIHLTVHRPWGTYTVLENNNGYKIKKIEVKPAQRLSLQKHLHRNEHWIVVSGTATVTVGEETKLIRPNESTYIKMGEQHRLANNGKIPVVMIEVQVGEYVEEDDIIRYDDDYLRN
jgi:mannose-1-phosphate guanylyltransferase